MTKPTLEKVDLLQATAEKAEVDVAAVEAKLKEETQAHATKLAVDMEARKAAQAEKSRM